MSRGPKYVSHVGPREFAEIFEEEKKLIEEEQAQQKAKVLGDDRVRNILKLEEGAELTQVQKDLAKQMTRVIKGERLTAKNGTGFFSIPHEHRKPDTKE